MTFDLISSLLQNLTCYHAHTHIRTQTYTHIRTHHLALYSYTHMSQNISIKSKNKCTRTYTYAHMYACGSVSCTQVNAGKCSQVSQYFQSKASTIVQVLSSLLLFFFLCPARNLHRNAFLGIYLFILYLEERKLDWNLYLSIYLTLQDTSLV